METTTLALLGHPESFYTWRRQFKSRGFGCYKTAEEAMFSAHTNGRHGADIYHCVGPVATLVGRCWNPSGKTHFGISA